MAYFRSAPPTLCTLTTLHGLWYKFSLAEAFGIYSGLRLDVQFRLST